MKTIHQTYQFAIQPTPQQTILLEKHFGSVRFVFNHFLNERKEQYLERLQADSYHKQAALLRDLKKQDQTSWLNEVNSQSLQFALRSLERAFIHFFKGKSEYPEFKSKKDKNSFIVPQYINLQDDKLSIPKFRDGLAIILDRKIQGKINSCTIYKTPTGYYYASLLCEVAYQPKNRSPGSPHTISERTS